MPTSFSLLKGSSESDCYREISPLEPLGETPEIETRNLSLYFGKKKILDRVTITMASGEITALTGPRGSGKTAFLRCINRFNDLIPNARVEGWLTIAGRNVYDRRVDSIPLWRLVGLVGPRPNPFAMSVYDNVAYTGQLKSPQFQRSFDAMVEESLRTVGLWNGLEEAKSLSALSLSPVDRQRLCIARILITRPKILLFDEPCREIAPSDRWTIESLITSLGGRYTILLATRDGETAERVAGRRVVLQSGHLADSDSENELSTMLADRAKFVSCPEFQDAPHETHSDSSEMIGARESF